MRQALEAFFVRPAMALLDRAERAHTWFVDTFGRVEPLFALGAIGLAMLWVLGTWDIDPNPDSYYHMGVAASYVAAISEGRWLNVFPLLPFTILGEEPFPNVYLLQHLLLAPLTRVLAAGQAIYVAMGLTGFALLASIYYVLRGWQVRGAIWWTLLPWLISPSLFAYVVLLKGAAFFLIWLVWAIDATVRRKWWMLGLFSLLAGYSYVASYLLLPVVGCFALAALLYRRRLEWQGVAAALGGWLVSSVVNPGFPNNLKLIWMEFGNALSFPGAWEAGIWIGAEWSGLTLHSLAISLSFALIPWIFAMPLLPTVKSVGRTLGGCLIASIMALVLAFYAGSKGVSMAAVMYCLLLPLALHRLNSKPRMSWLALLWLTSALGYSHLQGYNPYNERTKPSFLDEAWYLASVAGQEAGDIREDGQYPVIVAPWYDFPWLFYFNPRNYYVAGMNLLFLSQSPDQLEAYHNLFAGQVRNPEILLPRCFFSRLIVMYRDPGLPGENQLLEILQSKSRYFTEVPLQEGSSRRMFKLNEQAVAGRLKALDEAEEPLPLCADPPPPTPIRPPFKLPSSDPPSSDPEAQPADPQAGAPEPDSGEPSDETPELPDAILPGKSQ